MGQISSFFANPVLSPGATLLKNENEILRFDRAKIANRPSSELLFSFHSSKLARRFETSRVTCNMANSSLRERTL
jgi:hypothetical protein